MAHQCANCDHNCDHCHEVEAQGCPVCGRKGMEVGFNTIESLVKPFIKRQLTPYQQEQFYLCTTKACNVGYYTESGAKIPLNQMEVPIWFKRNKELYYVCYCRRITLQDCMTAVEEGNAKTIEEVIAFWQKENIVTNCELNNPTGKSCEPLFKNAIEYALKKKA